MDVVPAVTKYVFEGRRLVCPRALSAGGEGVLESGRFPSIADSRGSFLGQVLCFCPFATEDLREITVGHRSRSVVSSLSRILDVP